MVELQSFLWRVELQSFLWSQTNRVKIPTLCVFNSGLQIPDTRLLILVWKEKDARLGDSGHETSLTKLLMKNLTKQEGVSIWANQSLLLDFGLLVHNKLFFSSGLR